MSGSVRATDVEYSTTVSSFYSELVSTLVLTESLQLYAIVPLENGSL